MEASPEILLLLFAVALGAGIIDAIAGGGGLITLPVLIMSGLSPAQAIATNKIQALSSVASSAHRFLRNDLVNRANIVSKLIASISGATVGAFAIQAIDPSFLGKFIPVILIAVAVFFLISPYLPRERKSWISENSFAFFCAVPIGFYDGFFGPGTGSLYAAAFVLFLARDLKRATAETKILNAGGSLIAALIFLRGGSIVWPHALAMSAGALIGGQIGAHVATKWGAPLIRIGLVAISILLAVRIILS